MAFLYKSALARESFVYQNQCWIFQRAHVAFRALGGALFFVFEVIFVMTADAEYLVLAVFLSNLRHMPSLLLGTRHNLDTFVCHLMADCIKIFILLDTVSHLCHVTLYKLMSGRVAVYYSSTGRPGGIHRRMSIFADVELVPVCARVCIS